MTRQYTGERKERLDALIDTGLLSHNGSNGYTISVNTARNTLGTCNTNELKRRHGTLLSFKQLYDHCEIVLYDHKIGNCPTGELEKLLDTLNEYNNHDILGESEYADLALAREREAWKDYVWDSIVESACQLCEAHDPSELVSLLDSLVDGGSFEGWAMENAGMEEEPDGSFAYNTSAICAKVDELIKHTRNGGDNE